MSKWKTKLAKAIPVITKIKAEKERIEAEKRFNQLWQPVENLELDLDPGSESSFDGFENFLTNSHLKASSDFSDDFKKTMQLVRKELNLLNNDLLQETVESVATILNSSNNFNSNAGISPPQIEEITIPPVDYSIADDQISESSFKSGVWQRLQDKISHSKKFQVSPPGFNAYNQEEKHWLERPAISWNHLNSSQLKCEKWLREHNSNDA